MRHFAFSLVLLVTSGSGAVHAQGILQLGTPVEQSLATGDAHAYTLDLEAGQFIFGAADQLSVDVVVTVTGPDGVRLGSYDRSTRGLESFQFMTTVVGVHTVTVAPYGSEEGRYAVRLDRAEPVATTPEGEVDQLFAEVDNDRSPGAVVGVIRRGEVVLARAYGMASLTHGAPFTVDTPTNIGSTSKQFTAYAVALLAQRGALTLDDNVREHLPELPEADEVVTLRHLLTHTSGYREYLTVLPMTGLFYPEDYVDRDDVVGVVRRQPELQNVPGAEWNYTNTGYGLLALVVERVTGEPFQDWMQANVFGPHGMDRTVVRASPYEVVPGRAEGYTAAEGGGWREAIDLGGPLGDGAIYAPVGDLLRWMDTYRTLGDETPRRAMTTEYVTTTGDSTGYGLGLFLGERGGLRTVEHDGSDAGHRSLFVYYPEIESGVVVLTNSPTIPASATTIARAFFADAFPHTPAPHAVQAEGPGAPAAAETFDAEAFDPADFDAYVGRYEFDASGDVAPGGVLTFSRDGDRLLLQILSRPLVELVPAGPAVLESPATGARVEFLDGVGTPRLVFTEGRSFPATRLPDESQLVPEDFAGRYVSAEMGAVYTVRVANEGLELTHVRLDDPVPLQRVSGDRFRGGFPLGYVEFDRGAGGSVTGFVASTGRTRGVRFDRVN